MKVFIAGTMQGTSIGYDIRDQAYRLKIQNIVRKHFPHSDIICPYAIMSTRFKDQFARLAELHGSFSFVSFFEPEKLGSPLSDVICAFRELVNVARTSDLLISYLPDRIPSMGTAVEMWAAYSNGARVVTITDMTQNLAVLSTSTFVVSSVEKLDELFESQTFD